MKSRLNASIFALAGLPVDVLVMCRFVVQSKAESFYLVAGPKNRLEVFFPQSPLEFLVFFFSCMSCSAVALYILGPLCLLTLALFTVAY